MTGNELSFLADIINRQSERLDVDYKRWLDRDDHLTRAKLARHMCAMANHGGGYIVLGIEDDGAPSSPLGVDVAGYTTDWANSISTKYLEPAPSCEVHAVEGEGGAVAKVIVVPSHGSVPVCAKANGPDTNGKPQGIRSGAYYVRATGPQSVEISGPVMWRELIHRCVVNEREALLSSIGRLFTQPTAAPASADVRSLLTEAEAAWFATKFEPRAVDPHQGFATYAFRLLYREQPPSPLPLGKLRDVVTHASEHAEQQTEFGWAVFERWIDANRDAAVDVWDDLDALTNVQLSGGDASTPRLWRISTDGRGWECRVFHEDIEWVRKAVTGRQGPTAWEPGAYFSPRWQSVRAYQFALFVAEFAKAFEAVDTIELGVGVRGLKTRKLRDSSGYFSVDRTAHVDTRAVAIRVTPERLIGSGAFQVASELVAPMARLFDGFDVHPVRVERYVANLTK